MFYFNSKGKSALDLLGQPYFIVDEYGISCKMHLFSKRVINQSWDEIHDIKLKLFEVQIKTNKEWISINLEKLSDDNLKLVKSAFEGYQKLLPERAKVVALA